MVRRGNYHRIDIFPCDKFPEIVVGAAIGRTAVRPRCVEGVRLFLRGGAARRVHIADGEHLTSFMVQECIQQVTALLACTDKTQGNTVIRPGCGTPDARREYEWGG